MAPQIQFIDIRSLYNDENDFEIEITYTQDSVVGKIRAIDKVSD